MRCEKTEANPCIEPLADARFNGTVLTCTHHDREFSGESGDCIKGKPCTLAEYPLKIENGEVMVDTANVTPCLIG